MNSQVPRVFKPLAAPRLEIADSEQHGPGPAHLRHTRSLTCGETATARDEHTDRSLGGGRLRPSKMSSY